MAIHSGRLDITESMMYLQFLLSGAITSGIGALAYFTSRKRAIELNSRDGYVIVTGGWILFSLFGTLPFLLTGSIPVIYGCIL